MRLPSGYGSIVKLNGNRRKPYAARVTVCWVNDDDTKRSIQKYKYLGYFETKKDALEVLAKYHQNPFDLNASMLTLGNLYDKWSNEHFPTISEANRKGYRAAWKICAALENHKLTEISLDALQSAADKSGKNTPTLKKYKSLLRMMFRYAVIHDYITKEYDKTEYINITKPGNPNARTKRPFKKSEISHIWKIQNSNLYYSVILIMIYTGVRVGELLDLKKEDVNLTEKYFYVRESKTEAGIRYVPIADKIMPFFEKWYTLNECEYLISNRSNQHFLYSNFREDYFDPLMEQLNFSHKPHDTRHTCISRLAAEKVDERIIRKIVGHKGQGVTEITYTHFEIDELREAINRI